MTHDSINRPAHYAEGRSFEPIDVIADWELNYHLGNTLKYISRAGRKQDQLEDLKKARWYLDREISTLEPTVPFEATYEDIVAGLIENAQNGYEEPSYYGHTLDLSESWPAAQPVSANHDSISFDVDEDDWSDFWVGGWDDSVGPVEVNLSQEEIDEVMSNKDLNSFQTNEIIATIEKREMIIGVRKDGSTCVLKNGYCT